MEGERSELTSLQKKLVRARVSNNDLTQLIETDDPAKALESLHALGDALRTSEKNPKGFKQS